MTATARRLYTVFTQFYRVAGAAVLPQERTAEREFPTRRHVVCGPYWTRCSGCLSDNERAILITALRRLVDFDPQPLSPQIQALKAILERLGRSGRGGCGQRPESLSGAGA
jgi:hypothetical protein